MDEERKDQEQDEHEETLQDLAVPDESAEDIKGGQSPPDPERYKR